MDDSQKTELTVSAASHSSLTVIEPHHFFAAHRKTLEARIAEVQISQDEIEDIENKKSKKLIRDTLLGTFLIGKIAKTIIDWNEGVDKDIKELKKSQLIEIYINKTDKNEDSISKLVELISDPSGSVLFNKIISIINDNPPDHEQYAHLAAALKHITESGFAKLFDEHKYAISQIGQMTPQALSILADNKNWPAITLGTVSSSGGKITSDYNDEFAITFARSKGINDKGRVDRLKHSISELISRRFIEAHTYEGGEIRCVTTNVGGSLLPYLSNSFI